MVEVLSDVNEDWIIMIDEEHLQLIFFLMPCDMRISDTI